MKESQRRYANQNLISFQPIPRNRHNPFGVYNKAALFNALEDLNLYAFKLYLYLGGFQDTQQPIYLSKQDVLAKMHMKEKSYFIAKKELKEKGYLIKDKASPNKNAYIFIEAPYSPKTTSNITPTQS